MRRRYWLSRGSRKPYWSAAKPWVIPAVLALGVMVAIHATVQAAYNPDTAQLTQYVQSHRLYVYTKTDRGTQQVFYQYDGHDIKVTDTGYNEASVTGSGRYIVWQGLFAGGSQIFLYDVVDGTTVQLTASGMNQWPSVASNGVVTWQVWDGTNWQVMYYNGLLVQQLTNSTYDSVKPATNGNKIVYAEQISSTTWKAQQYDIATNTFTTVRQGDAVTTAYPHITKSGMVTTSYTEALKNQWL